MSSGSLDVRAGSPGYLFTWGRLSKARGVRGQLWALPRSSGRARPPFTPGSQLATNSGMNWKQLARYLIFLLKKSVTSLSLLSCFAFCSSHCSPVTRRAGGDCSSRSGPAGSAALLGGWQPLLCLRLSVCADAGRRCYGAAVRGFRAGGWRGEDIEGCAEDRGERRRRGSAGRCRGSATQEGGAGSEAREARWARVSFSDPALQEGTETASPFTRRVGTGGCQLAPPLVSRVGGSLGASVRLPALSQLPFFHALRQKWPAGPVVGPTGHSVLPKINASQNVGRPLCRVGSRPAACALFPTTARPYQPAEVGPSGPVSIDLGTDAGLQDQESGSGDTTGVAPPRAQ